MIGEAHNEVNSLRELADEAGSVSILNVTTSDLLPALAIEVSRHET